MGGRDGTGAGWWVQEDAHEFARYLIEAMHEAALKSHRIKNAPPALQQTTFIYQVCSTTGTGPIIRNRLLHIGFLIFR